jgi:hypothetical protein
MARLESFVIDHPKENVPHGQEEGCMRANSLIYRRAEPHNQPELTA